MFNANALKITCFGRRNVASSSLWVAILGAVLIFSSLLAAYLPSVRSETGWSKTYGGTNGDWGFSVVQSSDGGYVIAGVTSSYGAGGNDVYLIKTDPSGFMVWNKTFGGTDNDFGFSVVQSSDGGYVIAGVTSSYGAGEDDIYLIKTDSAGSMLWNKTYGGTNFDDGCSVIQTSDSGYAIVGVTSSYGTGGDDVYLIKTDPSGFMVWNKTYGGTSNDSGCSVIQTSDSGYVIAGITSSYGAGGNDVYLVKTDSAGSMLWNKTYGGTSNDSGSSVIQTSDGGCVIAGVTSSYGAGGNDVYLIKTDPSGFMVWNKTYGGTNNDNWFSMIRTTDGGYAIAGYTSSNGACSFDVCLSKTDSDGNNLSSRFTTPEFPSTLILLVLSGSMVLSLILVKRKLGRIHN